MHHALVHPLQPDDSATRELAGFCHHELRLIQERTAEVEKLRASLKEYYPQALPWFEKWTSPAAWDFIVNFPTHDDLLAAKHGKFIALLRHHHMKFTPHWQQLVADRQKQAPWPADAAGTHVQSHVALDAIAKLRAIQRSLEDCQKHIAELFAKHPDAHVFKSLPGAGKKLGPRILAHFGSRRDRFDSAHAVQEISGVAPVTRARGNSRDIKLRRACRKDFRHNLYWLAFASMKKSPWTRAFYDLARAPGDDHAEALRKLGCKLVKIIFRLWQDREDYEERRYLRALKQHGSPLPDSLS